MDTPSTPEKIPCSWEHDGYVLRSTRAEDVDAYWKAGFAHPDPEVDRLTATRETFTEEQVKSFFMACLEDPDRRDFLICAPDGTILGEAVVNEIDWFLRSANFRIALFSAQQCGQGIGSWTVTCMRDYAFSELQLHRLSLDVLSCNPRAKHVYEKAGFKTEGVLRDAEQDGEKYCDDILMAILNDEWRALKEGR